MNQPITYSSEITLSLAKFNNIYLYSDGFMMTELELNSFHKLQGNLFNDFKNAVFKVLPVINFKWTEQVLQDVVKDDFTKLQTQACIQISPSLVVKDRKAIVLGYLSNLDGEVNSNISLNEKMKATPLVFSSSQFHLVHTSSLKFLSLNDDNIENLFFELVDFPCQGAVLKFVPCLQFQKLRTNSVFNGDPVIITSTKTVCNRSPQLYKFLSNLRCTTYQGLQYESQMSHPDQIDQDFQKELVGSRTWASVEDHTRWRVNTFYAVGQNDKNKLSDNNLCVGDVITLNLSEMNRYLNVLKPYDTFTKILEVLNKEDEDCNLSQESDTPIETPEQLVTSNIHQVSTLKTNANYTQNRKNIFKSHLQKEQKQQAKNQIDPLGDTVILKKIIIEDVVLAFQDILSQDNSNSQQKTMIVIPNSCYWKIESENFQEGGKIAWEKKYRLRHFQTGRYLKISVDETSKTLAELTSEASSDSLFKFCPIQNAELHQGKFLWKDSFFYILHLGTNKYVGITDEDEIEDSELIKNTQKELNLELSAVYLSVVQNHFNTYRMKRIDFQDTWETSMLLYSLPFFMEAINYINQLNKDFNQLTIIDHQLQTLDEIRSKIHFYKIHQRIFSTLDNFIAFMNNKMISNISMNQEFSMIVPNRQNIMRSQQVFPLLCWLLFRAFPNKEEIEKIGDANYNSLIMDFLDEKEFMISAESFVQNGTIYEHTKALSRLDSHHIKRKLLISYKIYMTIKEICNFNPENQFCLVKFINILQKHIGFGEEVIETLISGFSNNESILQSLAQMEINQVSRSPSPTVLNDVQAQQAINFKEKNNFNLLDGLVQKILEFPSFSRPDIISFLSNICFYNEDPLFVNQDIILRSLVQDKQVSQIALMTITYQDGKDLYLEYYDRNNITQTKSLPEFLDDNNSEQNPQFQKQYNYLRNQLDLFANLCLHRNVVACQTFNQIFQLNLLIKYGLSEKFDNDIKAIFHRLIRTIYIDREPYTIQKRPELVRIVNYDRNILFPDIIQKKSFLLIFSRTINLSQLNQKHNILSGIMSSQQQSVHHQGEFNTKQNFNIINDEREQLLQDDQNNLKQVLNNYKQELLKYVEEKYDQLCNNSPTYKVYNVLTFEIIKIIDLIIKFGLFSVHIESSQYLNSESDIKIGANMSKSEKKKQQEKLEEQMKESDMEKLINYLSYFLEYDENYFLAMNTAKLQRKHVEQRKHLEDLKMNKSMTLLKNIADAGQKLTQLKSLFTNDDSEQQESKNISTSTCESEITQDPLFNKIRSLKKILLKSLNKTFTIKEEITTTNYEVLIKIEVCKIFSYLLDLMQDQKVDNMLVFFQTIFVPKIVNKIGDARNPQFMKQLIGLFAENQLEIGQGFDKLIKRPVYTESQPLIRSFDCIVERPFYESLIFALYFSNDSRLQNEIVNLIQKYSSQKSDFQENVNNLQLLLAPEVKFFFKDWNHMLDKMKSQILKCQSWLQMGTPVKQNKMNEENMKSSTIILEEVRQRFNKNQLDTKALKTKQKIFMHVGAFDNILFLLRNCQRMIDTEPKVFLFHQTDDKSFQYQIEIGQNIIKIMSLIMQILTIFFYSNYSNQILIQNKIVPFIIPYTGNNFGQVSLLINLYKDNHKIVQQMDYKIVFKFVMDLIKKHGRYPEFLEIFYVIITSIDDLHMVPDLPKSMLASLMDHHTFEQVNPFGDQILQIEEFLQTRRSAFYSYEPDLKTFKTKFIIIVSKCLQIEVSVNQIQQIKASFSMRDLLQFILEIIKENVNDNSNYYSFNVLMIKQALIEIIMKLVTKINSSLGELTQQTQLVQEFIELEIQSMLTTTTFSNGLKNYLFLHQLPLILRFIESFLLDASTQIFGASQTQKKDRKRLYVYGQTFMKIVNLMTSMDIIDDKQKSSNLKRLCSVLNLDLLPSYLKNSEDNMIDDNTDTYGQAQISIQNDDLIHEQFDARLLEDQNQDEYMQQTPRETTGIGFQSFLQRFKAKFKKVGIPDSALNERHGREFLIDDDSKLMMDYWNLFSEILTQSEVIEIQIKKESLSFSNSLWNVSKMFQSEVKGDQKDLLLVNQDIILKLLHFIEYWQQNQGDIKQVIFVLQVLYKILKVSIADQEELQYRQLIYDNLNATKILMNLLWNENEVDHNYLKYILKLFNLLLYGGNAQVQKTIYDYVLSYTECEKFFYKINSIITQPLSKDEGSIQMVCITKTLELIQLLCKGHNLNLQNYLHHQKNSKNSYDIVVMCSRLLTSLKIDNLNLKIVTQCVDTVNELVQGPCRNNQLAIGNSKFLEYALSILSEDEKVFAVKVVKEVTQEPKLMNVLMSKQAGAKFKQLHGMQKILKEHEHIDHQRTRVKLMNPDERYCLQIHPGKLAKLKYKCLVGIVGLLEASEGGDHLLLRIIRTIPLNVLTENLLYIFKLYEKYKMKDEYEQSLFDRENQHIDTSKDDDYYELIIESGFLIFALIQMFLQNKKGKDILHEDSDMRDILNVFQKENNDKKSLFGSLGELSGIMASRISNLKTGLDNALKSDEEKRKEEDIQKKQKKKELLTDAVNFFKRNTKSIEVFRDDKVYTVYFPKLPFCHMLPKDSKDEFHENVIRTNSKSKVTYLMVNSELFIRTMRHEERLRILFNYSPILGFFADNGKLWANLSFLNVIIINLIICASYSQYFIPSNVQPTDSDYPQVLLYERLYDPRFLLQQNLYGTKRAILILGLTELVLSSLIVFFFLLKRAPLKIFGIWQDFNFQSEVFFKSIFVGFFKILQSLFILLQDFDIIYNSTYIFAGIVGLTIHPFFFAIHLMDFFKLENLKTVVKAIWQPRVELGIVLMLLLIFEYYFTIISWVFLYEDYDPLYYVSGALQNLDGQTFCTEFWLCYVQTFNWTFKFTGSIGTHLQDPDTYNYEKLTVQTAYDNVDANLVGHFVTRFIYDNIFNLFFLFILINMIQGIIIDTFGSLREKLSDKVEDQQYTCFVCGIEMEKLDKNSESDKGFDYHIVVEHYMWNYLYFRAYIEQKNPQKCDGNESFVRDKLRNSDLNWFPIGRAKCIVDDDDEQLHKTLVINELNKNTTKLDDKVEKVEQKSLQIRDQLALYYEGTSL